MPLTHIDFPILQSFFCSVEARTGMPPQPLDATPQQAASAQRKEMMETERQRNGGGGGGEGKTMANGVVLGPDGKPYVRLSSTLREEGG